LFTHSFKQTACQHIGATKKTPIFIKIYQFWQESRGIISFQHHNHLNLIIYRYEKNKKMDNALNAYPFYTVIKQGLQVSVYKVYSQSTWKEKPPKRRL